MTEEEYRQARDIVSNIVDGNFAWSDPTSTVCLDQQLRNPDKFPKGSAFQSFDESLEDVIRDLTAYRDERRIESSFQSAEL